jgi:hypothetical protein
VKTSSAILAAIFVATPSLACAPATSEGRFVHVELEEALVIWDGPAQREHLIRRASFATDAKDFGFLVPTPGKPELAEADDAVFGQLVDVTSHGVRPAAAALTVLEQKVVAGYEAAVLEATDANALYEWLKAHGYRSDAQLVAWTRPYVQQGWKITAFKIAGNAPKVATKALRMSFQTERPFFPYREPQSQRAPGSEKRERLLHVYFLADARFDGAIGGKQAWAGRTLFSKRIDEVQRLELLKLAHLPIMAGGGGRWLTEFEDRSSPRPGTDEVFFERSVDQSTVERVAPPQEASGRSSLMTGAGVLAMLGMGYGAWRLARRSNG